MLHCALLYTILIASNTFSCIYSNLQPDDKYIVIASDGVWEFITNQMVADLVAETPGDPLAACKRIVTMAYDLWLQ